MRHARDLPNDVEALKRLILEQQALIDSHALEIERLRVQLSRLRQQRYGRSSEKLDEQIEQLELTLEDLESLTSAAGSAVLATPRTTSDRSTRSALAEHLPRESNAVRRRASVRGIAAPPIRLCSARQLRDG